ncbi:MAG: hypothetical protein ABW023_16630 [Sphingomonas sp.]
MKAIARPCIGALALVSLASTPARAAGSATGAEDKPGSLYLQCDGQPNNMTTGESAARLLGAVTLLGLFAPRVEAADASKRKFGAEGVSVCTALLDGEKKEGNPSRRVDLLLGRAIHQIEAKNYQAAITDAGLARREAEAAGLMSDPYYARSQGRAFGLVEAAALYRLDRVDEARDTALRDTTAARHSFMNLISVPSYLLGGYTPSETESAYIGWRARAGVTGAALSAKRLEEWGKFAEAAQVRDALADFNLAATPDLQSSALLAQAAVTHALAGNDAIAAERAAAARTNFEKRRDEGKPEGNGSEIVELLDLYSILHTAKAGDLKTARRLFAARSQWVAASFGCVVEATRRLRDGAAADEMIGGLANAPETMRKDRDTATRAETLAKDTDNKTLFWLLPGVDPAKRYEAVSKQVWRTDKSKLLLQVKDTDQVKFKMERLFLYGFDTDVLVDAYALHAALLAKSRGQQGFVIMPSLVGGTLIANFRTGNRGEPGLPDVLFNDADEVIADLSKIIPDPETLKALQARRAAAR